MKKGSIVVLKKARGTRLSCKGGDLWITEPNSLDIHLKEGEEHYIGGSGKTVIQAIGQSRLEIL